MFIREKVVCIKPYEEIGGRILKDDLSYGKTYEVITPGINSGGMIFIIKNDLGNEETYFQNKFITITEYREKLLEQIIS